MNIDLLKRLCETPAVSGRESRVRDLILGEVDDLFDDVEVDPLGSLICWRRATRDGASDARTVMVLCHMDEIGFYVSHVSDDGFVHVDPAGIFDPRHLFGRRVLVCAQAGDFPGAMNAKGRPIHIASRKELQKVPKITDFVVDTGLGARAKEFIKIGDYVVVDERFVDLGDRIMSKALDNRVACWIGIEAIRKIVADQTKHAYNICVAFTAQEEVGLRGAAATAFRVAPDVAIGIDVTLACDTPGIPDEESILKLGDGFGLLLKDDTFIPDVGLVEQVEGLARELGLKCQRHVLRRGGQDGAAAQQARGGAKAVGIMVGTRYIHTATEMIDKDDLAGARDIVTAFLTS
ncbi:M42 family metallopeptidase [Hoeflea prorocentri]|uniref:M20/M25/M40 family metallo-hydrolase n=1 Tax=Hoeflea prorocentri TaxID=1922333 RepID=A0A9X3ZHJ5_9HYPH|nr:M20/M25/M40 family metallo-hydrolase [Hoeflea prorocentri]MCY6381912.1 M20/M25/M40 family metallo-hydrolase [Hoeflea prorocentri]MDA5399712.1 M20/M25/M40 family metallo-hydrolase [Hoeflea prorocentri]